jgi:hypothetical protein
MRYNHRFLLVAFGILTCSASALADTAKPTLGKASIDSIPAVRASQVLDPESNELSVLMRSLEVHSTERCGGERAQMLTVTVPVSTDVAARLKLDTRGAVVTADKLLAQCVVQVNEQSVSTWRAGNDTEFQLSAVVDVAAHTDNAVFVILLSCASSKDGADASAYVDSLDFSIELAPSP